jgi:enoyl-CoA hydratase/carnithine racemase
VLWRLERHERAALLRFDNPPRNFLTFAAFAELEAQLEQLALDEGVSVVVLASAVPGYFAAHADLDELTRLQDGPLPEARSWYTAMRALERLPQPVVALLSGQVWGGGLELALACDLRLALPGTHLRLPEIDLGFIPGAGGTQRMLRLLGPACTAELVMTGRVVEQQEAARLGLVRGVDDVDAAWQLIGVISRKSRAALMAAKRVIREGAELPLREGLRLEGGEFANLLGADEARALVTSARAAYAAAAPSEHVHV